MPPWRATSLEYNSRSDILTLIWLFKATEETRQTLESELNAILTEMFNDGVCGTKRHILSVPWLRKDDSTHNDLLDIAALSQGVTLFLDAEGLEKKTLIAAKLDLFSPDPDELGRAKFEDAMTACHRLQTIRGASLEVAFEERPWQRIQARASQIDKIYELPTFEYTLPAHIPSDLKIKEDTVTLFSLIKLTDEEIRLLRTNLGDNGEEIVIFNWPNEIPASQKEMYDIFQCVKAPYVEPYEATFVFFIDSVYFSGPLRQPNVFIAEENILRPPCNSVEQVRTCSQVKAHAFLQDLGNIKNLWSGIWHPTGNETYGDTRVNTVFTNRWQNARLDVTRGEYTIANPNLPIHGVDHGVTAFILCPVNPLELRAVRDILNCFEDEVQLIELALPDDEMSTLLVHFDSEHFRKFAEAPSSFIAIDRNILRNLLDWHDRNATQLEAALEDDEIWVLYATRQHYWHRTDNGMMSAREDLGYRFGPCPISELDSVHANIETSNMWLWELLGEDLGAVFWPEFEDFDRELLPDA